jgi:hypothetical protein
MTHGCNCLACKATLERRFQAIVEAHFDQDDLARFEEIVHSESINHVLRARIAAYGKKEET